MKIDNINYERNENIKIMKEMRIWNYERYENIRIMKDMRI